MRLNTKIGIVDDARVARMLLIKILKEAGYSDFVEADNGATGWEMIKSQKPDIVFCDCNMPVMKGLELLQKIRADGSTKSLPFVMVSAERMEADLERARENGVTEYVVKPFGAQAIHDIIHKHVK